MYDGGLAHAFCIEGDRGNPSFILVTNQTDDMDSRLCLALSRHFECEVTWVQRRTDGPQYRLRYFVPETEIEFCGHGTLAAAAWLARFQDIHAPIPFHVSGRVIPVYYSSAGTWLYEQSAFPLQPLTDAACIADITRSLGLTHPPSIERHLSVYRSCGAIREKLIVQLAEKMLLEKIEPDAAMRDAICSALNVTGIYAFCDLSDASAAKAAARHFPAHSAEDLATGAIAPTIAQHILNKRHHPVVNIFQGGKQSQTSHIQVSANIQTGHWNVGGECRVTAYPRLRDLATRLLF